MSDFPDLSSLKRELARVQTEPPKAELFLGAALPLPAVLSGSAVVAVHLAVGERARQITHEKHSPAADRRYRRGELARAAAAYALAAAGWIWMARIAWPWERRLFKPDGRSAVKAAGLILAEIERGQGPL